MTDFWDWDWDWLWLEWCIAPLLRIVITWFCWQFFCRQLQWWPVSGLSHPTPPFCLEARAVSHPCETWDLYIYFWSCTKKWHGNVHWYDSRGFATIVSQMKAWSLNISIPNSCLTLNYHFPFTTIWMWNGQVRAPLWQLHLLLHGARPGGQVAAQGEPAEGDSDQVKF